MNKEHRFNKHNMCVKWIGCLPLFSIKWTKNGIELLMFKIIPLLRIYAPEYKQIGDNVWELM